MKSEIQKFFKGDVEDSAETLTKYSRDASIFEIKPELVLFPKNSADVENLVKWVSATKQSAIAGQENKYANLSITARAAGTDMSGGAVNDSIIFYFTRYITKLILFN